MTTITADDVDQKDPLQNKVGQDHRKDLKPPCKGNGKPKDEENKRSLPAFKYSNDRKGPLHESIILAGIPMFIKLENGEAKAIENIEEPGRIIRPHRKEDCPYPPYEFANIKEVQECVNEAKSTNIESLHLKAKERLLQQI